MRVASTRLATRTERDEMRHRVQAVVDSIPRGRVATYGQVARLAGLPRRARWVGRVLSELPPGSKLAWHRVLGAGGRISLARRTRRGQHRRLLREASRSRAPAASTSRNATGTELITDALIGARSRSSGRRGSWSHHHDSFAGSSAWSWISVLWIMPDPRDRQPALSSATSSVFFGCAGEEDHDSHN
jgi:methylated-DNA-protein-cysteine methyltransferase-like protein